MPRLSVGEWVLDASVILAFINDEPGQEVFASIPPGEAAISTVNMAEVLARLSDYGFAKQEADLVFERLRLEIVPFDDELARASAEIRTVTRRYGLSLGDRACLALAGQLGLPVLTADRRWTELDVGVEVTAIRWARGPVPRRRRNPGARAGHRWLVARSRGVRLQRIRARRRPRRLRRRVRNAVRAAAIRRR